MDMPTPVRRPLERAKRLHAGLAALRTHASTAERDQLTQAARELEVIALAILADERVRAKEARGEAA